MDSLPAFRFVTGSLQVSYLKPAAIEAAGSRDAEVCYGCHGGRAWYRISYPYPRTPWPDIASMKRAVALMS